MIRVRLFGVYREWLGAPETSADVAAGTTVGELVARLRERPAFGRLPERPVVAVNRRYVGPEHPLGEEDEVALIPPVAGG